MKLGWRAGIGIALSALLLWWALRQVSLSAVWGVLQRSDVALLVIAALVATAIFPLRARRWRTILDPVAPRLPFAPLWRSTAVGMMVNNLVPARAGEIARAYLLTRQTAVPFSASIASLAVDRVFDSIVLLLLAFAAVLDPAFPAGVSIAGQPIARWAAAGAVIVLAALAGLYALVFFPVQLIRLFQLFARRLSPTLEARGASALHTFSSGLSVLRSPAHFAAVMGWTVAHWLVNALAWWLAFVAVGIQAPFSAALLLQALIAMGVAIPAAPGFFGVFEAIAVVGLAIYGVPATLATSWAIGFHILSFLPITLIGAYYFVVLGVRFTELRGSAASSA